MNRLRDFRLSAGLTLAQVAKSMNVNQSTYQKLETGALRLRMEHLITLASLYNCTIDELVNVKSNVSALASVGRALPVREIRDGKLVDTGEVMHIDDTASVEAFALRPGDDSMSPRINEYDLLVIEPTVAPKPGSIVIAHCYTGEHVVRKYTPLHPSDRMAPGYTLRPENSGFPEITEGGKKKGDILGVAVLRLERL